LARRKRLDIVVAVGAFGASHPRLPAQPSVSVRAGPALLRAGEWQIIVAACH
jgi:hypothetical protein